MLRGSEQVKLPMRRRTSPHHTREAGKMLVPLLGVLAVIAMAVAAAATYVLLQERDKRQAKERELQLALAENDDLKARLEDAQQSKTKIEDELTRIRKDLAQSKEELTKAVEAQETLSRSIEDREQEVGRLKKDLDQAHNESTQITGRLSELQAERETMKQQLVDLERAKGELESKVMELSERPTVELEKVTVTNGQTPGAGPSAGVAQPTGGGVALPVSAVSTASISAREGQVVVINREYDFIVMNLGKNHGLSVGQEFQVVRGNEVLGKVKVEKVYDELSAAAILPESKKNTMHEGDTVKAL